ncbi:hypothetical protein D3OALGA1CA_3535 [Olavius algarvensis associated proteobacterium Delta 3]|nr:hypothetical protein D3OALGB2SA_2337 [Olavius algarvensis associated proteobacterium Delta 3]CAB5135901.1 hypothetical protein D3OALGA1CA_3535 [Olavius algarvensis associated proteobacterium Delta 3]
MTFRSAIHLTAGAYLSVISKAGLIVRPFLQDRIYFRSALQKS